MSTLLSSDSETDAETTNKMGVQMTDEQFQQLLASLQTPQQQPQQHKSAAALGHMRQLDMGPDKMRRLKKFNEWLEEAENSESHSFIITTSFNANSKSSRIFFFSVSL